MKIALHLALAALLLVSVRAAAAQEDLLWKAENDASPTLVPLYQGWGTTFKTHTVKQTAPAADNKQKEADAEAAKAAMLAAQREALARQQEANAKKKAAAILAGPGAIGANMQNNRVEGILQGPAGNSMLLGGGRWLQQGAQLQVSSTIGGATLKAISGLQSSDTMAANLATEGLQARLAKQPSISITLVQVTSASAVFSDGHQRYTVKARQSAF
jgi:hypothetical protein